MAGGSLHDRLFGRAAQQPPLAPRQRWLIACHTAEVLRRDGETGGVPMERATENAREIMANCREIKEIMGEADWLERLGNEILDGNRRCQPEILPACEEGFETLARGWQEEGPEEEEQPDSDCHRPPQPGFKQVEPAEGSGLLGRAPQDGGPGLHPEDDQATILADH